MILILTMSLDETADDVERKLVDRGAAFRRLNPRDFPSRAELSISFSSAHSPRITWRAGDDLFDLAQVRAVWHRRPEAPEPDDSLRDPQVREYVSRESLQVLHNAWALLDCVWLPGPVPTIRNADQKVRQLHLARQLGFEVPPTLISNSPDELLAFYRHYDGDIVSKPASTAFNQVFRQTHLRYTESVTKRDIGYVSAARLCPTIYQAYVPKRSELRVTVVGEQVFAAEIFSQQTERTKRDWRRYDHDRTPCRAHTLPRHLEQQCRALVRELGLNYGALDLILRPDGQYVFLEINPEGEYQWIEHATGLPISDAICDVLMRGGGACG